MELQNINLILILATVIGVVFIVAVLRYIYLDKKMKSSIKDLEDALKKLEDDINDLTGGKKY